MKRIFLFLVTNLAVLFVINITLRILGVDRILNESGAIDFQALLILSAVIGFAGSLISLAMSKWSAKRMVGAQIIENPTDPTERWVLETVHRLAGTIVMWFSRQREFRADAGGAQLAGRNKMIAALERLKGNHEQATLPKKMSALGISGGKGMMRLFMTHPPLDERIAALRNAS